MKAFFRIFLLTLILITVAMMSALTAMRIAIHGREVVIPKMTGLTPSDAERVAIQSGVLVEVENHFYSAEVPKGHILSQLPPPGTKVRRGWRVRLAESLGPQQVTIPQLLGESPRAAEINIRRRGLELGSVATLPLPDEPPDQVIAQSPPADAQEVGSPRVSLLLAAPAEEAEYVMPNLVGKSLAVASGIIEQGGLKLSRVSGGGAPAGSPSAGTAAAPLGTSSSPAPASSSGAGVSSSALAVVIRQIPAAGQKVAAGTTVQVEVADH